MLLNQWITSAALIPWNGVTPCYNSQFVFEFLLSLIAAIRKRWDTFVALGQQTSCWHRRGFRL
jgi:hypothetical protein